MTAADSNARPLRGLVHAHTWHSFDSLLPPVAYLAYARRARLDFLVITDHNTLAGARAVRALNRDPGLEVVMAAEYSTERGDVIGLFLTSEIASRRFEDVVAEIRAQGGLVLLPHPFRGRDTNPERIASVDLVESFNARSAEEANGSALREARRLDVAQLAGADIHTLWELAANGTLVTLGGAGNLRDRLASADRTCAKRPMPRAIRRYSQLVKRIRVRVGLGGHA